MSDEVNETEEETTATIAVIGAMDEEVRQLGEWLSGTQQFSEAGLPVTVGMAQTNRGNTVKIVATVAGMGTVAAGAATQ